MHVADLARMVERLTEQGRRGRSILTGSASVGARVREGARKEQRRCPAPCTRRIWAGHGRRWSRASPCQERAGFASAAAPIDEQVTAVLIFLFMCRRSSLGTKQRGRHVNQWRRWPELPRQHGLLDSLPHWGRLSSLLQGAAPLSLHSRC